MRLKEIMKYPLIRAYVHVGNDYGFNLSLEQLLPSSVCGPETIFFKYNISQPHSETGTAKCRRLLIATHLDQPNHLANQEQVLGYVVPSACLTIMYKNTGHKAFW
jgi:hypothetical protein